MQYRLIGPQPSFSNKKHSIQYKLIESHPPLPDKKYSIIYADPPWQYYRSQFDRNNCLTGATDHYDTITTELMKTWDIDSIAENDCLLFMWATSTHLNEAIELGTAWKFKYITVAFVWNKERINVGHYTLSQCELCLLFKRGSIPKPRGARNIRQYVERKFTRHSEKPDEIRLRIEQMFPNQSKIELFARKTAHGWDSWGDEVT